MRYIVAVALVALASVSVARGQDTPAAGFEVASIKIEAAPSLTRFTILPGAHLRIAGQSLTNIIRQTFGSTGEFEGIPEWAQTMRVEIDAKAPSGSDSLPETIFPMLRTLLETRFAMKWHSEPREMPVFDLVVDRPGRLGPGLTPSADNCDGHRSLLYDRELPAAAREAYIRCGISMDRPNGVAVAWRMKGRTMDQFAVDLHRLGVTRQVRNRTHLVGRFDAVVEYTPEAAVLLTGSGGIVMAGVKEQLGLRLDPVTAPVDVIVIDHIERPSEN
jgi:uncharacterized protein (TIGR03435 family)